MRLGQHAFWLAALAFFAGILPACAADNPLAQQNLQLVWVLPFAGMLASLAFLPLAAPKLWHAHFGKVSAFWAAAFLIPCAFVFGAQPTASLTSHTLITEFLPFLIILIALYTVAGGIFIAGDLRSSAVLNLGILGGGALLASIIGTTGASMVLIRPLLRANAARASNVHVIVFFIFLVSNIGGALTPLGDPPLFIGYLKGVNFFWPGQHLFLPMLFCLIPLLAIFFALDTYYFSREPSLSEKPAGRLQLYGQINLLFMVLIIVTVLITPQLVLGSVPIFGEVVEINALLRDGLLLLIAALSLKFTPLQTRSGNGFHWGPVEEVGLLFVTIFITAAPVLAILQEGDKGALAYLTQSVSTPLSYFWLTGILSAFLDNAPTYLVFFQMAGGDAAALMGPMKQTLVAISCGAVFMGALSYIGNAPNFMVRAIAEDSGVSMPSFFGYIGWACLFLLPLFVLTGLIFF